MKRARLIHKDYARADEEWRPVPGYERTHEVSDLGRVRSLPRVTTRGRHVGGSLMQCTPAANGYVSVSFKVNGTVRRFLVHRLVAMAFIPNPDGLREVDHLDGRPDNNAKANLGWVTRAENMRRAALNGQRPLGDAHGLHRLTAADVRTIRQLAAEGLPSRKIGRQFSVSKTTVLSIAAGRTWGHVA
ncbi:NUMOD4 domain-containing protein [Achromobacter mucicolens]|uniref:NUMOD4 domain-containing protein n=1 Tax=Achromobacter mucicolens TaxID=1389922 RepID=UPI00244C49EE|nr:NUMOD4 domain-containing protein [Achromobacter mucicolens]MDG9966947.1 NUMOD4 domain-containing protein [Achromobacter mucicolens]